MIIPDHAKTYILKVDDGDNSLLNLLKALQELGANGSSRGITIEGEETRYGWDGDGSDKIYDIKVEGNNLEASDKYKEFIKKNK